MVSTLKTSQSLSFPPRRLWTREEFDKAEALNLFGPDERLELIEGELYIKDAYVNSPHATAQRRCEKMLNRLFAEGYDVRGQLPLALGERSKPLPDIAVVVGSEDDYAEAHPTTAILVVEISDTTLRLDRDYKCTLYARAGIPEYWIVNLNERVLEVYRHPTTVRGQYRYTIRTIHSETATLSPLAVPNLVIEVRSLLPPLRTPEM